jgi:hypothetical protein
MKQVFRVVRVMVFVMVAGCSQFREVTKVPFSPGEEITLTPELKKLYLDVASRTSLVRSIDGYADLYLSTPRRHSKAYCTVQLRKSTDARLIVTAGILGWPVADLFIRPDSLFVHDMLNNRMLLGRNSSENLGKIIGVDVGTSTLTETLFGLAELSEPPDAILSVSQGENWIGYMVRNETGIREVKIDPHLKVLSGITCFDGLGRRSVEFRFAEYQQEHISGVEVILPKEIDVILYRDDEAEGSRSLKVVYDERVINPPDFTIRYKRPSKAKTVNLDEISQLPWL